MSTKYQPGDQVVVRSDLSEHNLYYMENSATADTFVDSMLDFAGKTVTIEGVNSAGKYNIVGDGFNWTDEMFEGLANDLGFEPSEFNLEVLL